MVRFFSNSLRYYTLTLKDTASVLQNPDDFNIIDDMLQ